MLQVITPMTQNRNCMVQMINYMVIENDICHCTIGGYALSPSCLIRDATSKNTPPLSSVFWSTPGTSKQNTSEHTQKPDWKF